MWRIVVLAFAMVYGVMVFAAEPVVQKFELWGGTSKIDKLFLYTGFRNGLFAGASQPWRGDSTPARQLLICLLDSDDPPGANQAIAMIDKYYQDHPERWAIVLGQAIVEALMVEDGPRARFEKAEPTKAKSGR
jgi:hypothetical protein